jgi:23S rRNA (cytosine1962-C5)-methyltransferase
MMQGLKKLKFSGSGLPCNPRTMNPSLLENALADTWERKKALRGETQAFRLLNARASGTPRLVFELFGDHGILCDYGTDRGGTERGTGWRDSLRAAAPRWLASFAWKSISLLDRASAGESERSGSHTLAGDPPEELVIREGSLNFRTEPRHPRNVGLFLDTRELRKDLAARAHDARVLNLFAYTGSLGIAALSGGAAEVVQVDISARYLEWGRENLRLNKLPEDRCRFIRMDSERYLDWAAGKKLRFDHIILDPPVFSRFEGGVFRFESDYYRLAAKSAALLAPGGTLHAVTNYSGVSPADFAAGLARALRSAGISASLPRRVALPPDFDLPPDAEDLPEGNAMIYQILRD